MFLHNPQPFTEPLEVNDFPCPQEADGIAYFLIMNQAQDIIIGRTGFLLCCSHVRT